VVPYSAFLRREEFMIEISKATHSDFEEIWPIFHQVVERGDTYTFEPDISKEDARSIWLSEAVSTYVARLENEVVGTYILKPNQPGLGSHIANAGYMVDVRHAGKGIGAAMCEHSLEQAREAGYLAMQFNSVVSTNVGAVHLWKKLGFTIIGTVPKAFRHKQLGLVDIYIMHRFL
jgi:L-amino acid N-acyltransferase YncA